MTEITTVEDGTVVTVGDNYEPGMANHPLKDSIVYLEIDDPSAWDIEGSKTAGLTRDEAMDLVDSILAVLEEYGVGPRA